MKQPTSTPLGTTNPQGLVFMNETENIFVHKDISPPVNNKREDATTTSSNNTQLWPPKPDLALGQSVPCSGAMLSPHVPHSGLDLRPFGPN